jgi:alpha/beta superfamily hydrolase
MARLALPGARDVRATLDGPREAAGIVVACPPHPQYGGRRTDQRLTAVSDALAERDIACLRYDYGAWDEGRGERRDALTALVWARERFDHTAMFGYSFGAVVAARAVAHTDVAPAALSLLAPDALAADAIPTVTCPLQLICGERDDTVEWRPVSAAAEASDATVVTVLADHHFVGQTDAIGTRVADFLAPLLRD